MECLVISFTYPGEVRKVADRFKDLFSLCGIDFKVACCFFCYSLFGCKSLSELVKICPWSPSVSTLNRNLGGFRPNRAMKRLREQILKKYSDMNPNDFCYAVDDTANPRYGKTIFRSGRFGSSGGVYSGQKVLLIALVDIRRKIAFPLSYAFLTSKKDPNHTSAPEVAIHLFEEILQSKFPPLPVTADSWFDSFSFMFNLYALGLSYSGEIKSNRKVIALSGRKWKSLQQFFKGMDRRKAKKKYYSESTGLIRQLELPMKIIAVFNNKNDKKAFAYYVSTDDSLLGARLWKLSRARWCIECLFRDLKQNLSFGKLPCGGEGASDLSVCIPLILATSLRLDPEIWSAYSGATIGAKVKQFREDSLQSSIEFIARNPGDRKVTQFNTRRNSVNKKPTNRLAEAV
jgi:hypothetical protein